MNKVKFTVLAVLLVLVGMFSASAQTKGTKFDPTYTGYYLLRTQFTGDKLSLECNGAESPYKNGAAFMSSQGGATGQKWKFVPAPNYRGWYYLQTQLHGSGKSLECNGKESPVKGGASFMDNTKNVTGQLWKLEDAGNGYYRLRSKLHGQIYSLEGNSPDSDYHGGNSFMDDTQNVSGQLWYLVPVK